MADMNNKFFDYDGLMISYDGDAEFVSILLAKFVEEGEKYLSDLQTSIENNDLETFHRVAHSFKSSAANVMASEVSKLAQELEDASSQSFGDDIREKYQKFEEKCLLAMDSMKDHL